MGPFRLLRHRDFRLYFIGNLVSSLGNGMHLLAVAWFVLKATGSPAAVGLVIALAFGSALFVLPWGGVIVDRYERRTVAIACDLFRAVGVFLVAAAVLTGRFALWQVYVMTFVVSMGHNLFFPAIAAMVQQVIPREEYGRATSLNEIVLQVGNVGAAGLAGFAFEAVGLAGVLLLDGATYLVSAVALARISVRARPGGAREAFGAMLRGGVRFLRLRPALIAFGLAITVPFVATMSLNVLAPTFVAQVLQRDARTYGLLDMAYGVGAFLAGLAAATVAARIGRARAIGAFLAVVAAGYTLFAATPGLAAAFLLMGVLGFASSSVRVVGGATMLHLVPTEVMGRTQAAFGLASTLLQVTFALVTGRLAAASPALGFMLLGVLVVGALVTYLSIGRALLGAPALTPATA